MERLAICMGKIAAEIGAQQIGPAVRAEAVDEMAGPAQGGGQSGGVEFGVHRVPCGGVIRLEGEVGRGGQAVAGAAEGEPGGGEAAQIGPSGGRLGHQARPISAGERRAGMRSGVPGPARPMLSSQASNSGAGRRPSTPRR